MNTASVQALQSLYVICIQRFPGSLLPCTFDQPRTEVQRREQYIELLEGYIGVLYPNLVLLVKQCLQDIPDQRPSTDELLATLQRMKVEVEGEYGGSPIRLDMVRVRLAKEVKTKDAQIGELVQQQVFILNDSSIVLYNMVL